MSSTRNPVGWFEIYVGDMPRAKAFYEAVFATKLERLPVADIEMHAFPSSPDRGGTGGALVQMKGVQAGSNIIVYFTCADCAVEAARSAKAGGKVIKEKFSIGDYGFVALVHDTEGNMIGLHSLQ